MIKLSNVGPSKHSVLVCCTIHFMTTTYYQAILQTATEINLPMFSFHTPYEGQKAENKYYGQRYFHV